MTFRAGLSAGQKLFAYILYYFCNSV